MSKLERTLSAGGYRVLNLPYPSGRHRIELLAEHLEPGIGRICGEPGKRVHFVTHSMGGIVLRYYLDTRPCPSLGRVVMLGPPNRGSELVDHLRRTPLIRDHIGPSRGQLGTSPSDLPSQLGPPRYQLGIIAGGRSLNPLSSLLIPGPDDGMVSVERTKLAGMKDFLVVPHSHTFIMRSNEVIRQTIRFLREGSFDHTSPACRSL
jgi:pimeloyl-ACP methyl ester carboxylesterase